MQDIARPLLFHETVQQMMVTVVVACFNSIIVLERSWRKSISWCSETVFTDILMIGLLKCKELIRSVHIEKIAISPFHTTISPPFARPLVAPLQQHLDRNSHTPS